MNESLPSGHLEILSIESWGGLITLGEVMSKVNAISKNPNVKDIAISYIEA